jgi:hypothetical protein
LKVFGPCDPLPDIIRFPSKLGDAVAIAISFPPSNNRALKVLIITTRGVVDEESVFLKEWRHFTNIEFFEIFSARTFVAPHDVPDVESVPVAAIGAEWANFDEGFHVLDHKIENVLSKNGRLLPGQSGFAKKKGFRDRTRIIFATAVESNE